MFYVSKNVAKKPRRRLLTAKTIRSNDVHIADIALTELAMKPVLILCTSVYELRALKACGKSMAEIMAQKDKHVADIWKMLCPPRLGVCCCEKLRN